MYRNTQPISVILAKARWCIVTGTGVPLQYMQRAHNMAKTHCWWYVIHVLFIYLCILGTVSIENLFPWRCLWNQSNGAPKLSLVIYTEGCSFPYQMSRAIHPIVVLRKITNVKPMVAQNVTGITKYPMGVLNVATKSLDHNDRQSMWPTGQHYMNRPMLLPWQKKRWSQ